MNSLYMFGAFAFYKNEAMVRYHPTLRRNFWAPQLTLIEDAYEFVAMQLKEL
jgi:hypothetical protein